MEIKRAVIPAAGRGKRFFPVTRAIPKEMLPVWNIPAIQFAVSEARLMGVREIILVISPSKSIISEYFRNQPDIKIVIQDSPTGLGDAIFRTRNYVQSEPFAVLLPDVIIRKKDLKMIKGGPFSVMLNRVEPDEVEKYGIARVKNSRLIGAIEKPTREKAPSYLALSGRYVLPTEIFGALLKCSSGKTGEIQLTEAIDRLAQSNPAKIVEVDSKDVLDIGTPAGMASAWQIALRESFEKHGGFNAASKDQARSDY